MTFWGQNQTSNNFKIKKETQNYYHKTRVMACPNWHIMWTPCRKRSCGHLRFPTASQCSLENLVTWSEVPAFCAPREAGQSWYKAGSLCACLNGGASTTAYHSLFFHHARLELQSVLKLGNLLGIRKFIHYVKEGWIRFNIRWPCSWHPGQLAGTVLLDEEYTLTYNHIWGKVSRSLRGTPLCSADVSLREVKTFGQILWNWLSLNMLTQFSLKALGPQWRQMSCYGKRGPQTSCWSRN